MLSQSFISGTPCLATPQVQPTLLHTRQPGGELGSNKQRRTLFLLLQFWHCFTFNLFPVTALQTTVRLPLDLWPVSQP